MPFNPQSRDSATLTPSEYGDDLYLFGGRGHELFNQINKYNYSTRTWEFIKTNNKMTDPEPRFGHVAFI